MTPTRASDCANLSTSRAAGHKNATARHASSSVSLRRATPLATKLACCVLFIGAPVHARVTWGSSASSVTCSPLSSQPISQYAALGLPPITPSECSNFSVASSGGMYKLGNADLSPSSNGAMTSTGVQSPSRVPARCTVAGLKMRSRATTTCTGDCGDCSVITFLMRQGSVRDQPRLDRRAIWKTWSQDRSTRAVSWRTIDARTARSGGSSSGPATSTRFLMRLLRAHPRTNSVSDAR